MLHPHVGAGTQRVHADVRVARVHEDLLVLLEPGVQGVPLEPHMAGDPVARVPGVDPGRRVADLAGDPQPVPARRTEAQTTASHRRPAVRATSARGM